MRHCLLQPLHGRVWLTYSSTLCCALRLIILARRCLLCALLAQVLGWPCQLDLGTDTEETQECVHSVLQFSAGKGEELAPYPL
eukprot:1212340-Amphidinium_carterae.1